jgi:hypothetical protein
VRFELTPHFEWITSFPLIHHIVAACSYKQRFAVVLLVIFFIITAGASSYSQVQECFPPLPLLNFSLSFIFSLGRSNNASFFVGNGKTEVEQENSLGYKIDKEEMETLVKHRDPLLLLLLEF